MLRNKKIITRIVSCILALVLLITSVAIPEQKNVQAASSGSMGTASVVYMDHGLSISNATIGKLDNHATKAMMCYLYLTINGSKEKVFCLDLNGAVNSGNIYYEVPMEGYGEWINYLKGVYYFYEDVDDNEFTLLSKDFRYKVGQTAIWRILQLKENGVAATYNNLMSNEYKDILSDFCDMAGINKATAWNYLSDVFKRVANNEKKILAYTTLFKYNNGSKQPLLWGTVDQIEEYAEIQIQKKGKNTGDKANLKGAVYGIFSDESCNNEIMSVKLDKNGYGTTGQKYELKPGRTYWVMEKEEPSGTVRDKEKHKVVAKEDGSAVKINLTNEELWIKIQVEKVDKNNPAKKLPGAIFTILEYNKNSGKYEEFTKITTGADGTATTGKLYYSKTNNGQYRIEEKKAPDGYENTGYTKDVTVSTKNYEDTVQYKVENPGKPGKFKIKKAAYLDDKLIEDIDLTATYHIFESKTAKEPIKIVKTNDKGESEKVELPASVDGTTYYIKEIYGKDSKPTSKVREEFPVYSGKVTTLTVNSTKACLQAPIAAGVTLKKTDPDGFPITGAVFDIYEWDGSSYSKYITSIETLNGIAKTESNKTLVRTKTNKGNFKIIEKKSDDNHVNTYITFLTKVTKENDETYIDLTPGTTAENPSKPGSLKIQKAVFSIIDGNHLNNYFNKGIQYTLYSEKNLTKPVKTMVLDDNGCAEIPSLDAGTYYLQETYANPLWFGFTNRFSDARRTVTVIIKAGQDTVVDANKGVSYDGGLTYSSTWSTATNGVVNTQPQQILETSSVIDYTKVAGEYCLKNNNYDYTKNVYTGSSITIKELYENKITIDPQGNADATKLRAIRLFNSTKGACGWTLPKAMVYKDKILDVKVTLNDWSINSDTEAIAGRFKTTVGPLSYSPLALAFSGKIVNKLDYTVEFFEAGTNNPVDIKGILEFRDVDGEYLKISNDNVVGYYAPNDKQSYDVITNASEANGTLYIKGKGMDTDAEKSHAFVLVKGAKLKITTGRLSEQTTSPVITSTYSRTAFNVAFSEYEPNAMVNIAKPIEILVVKKDKNSTKVLPGAEFSIYEYSISEGKYMETPVKTITTNSNGYAHTRLNPTMDNQGMYLLKETKAPDGYPATNFTKEIKANQLKSRPYLDYSTKFRGMFRSDYGYQKGDLVYSSTGGRYRCLISCVGKSLSNKTYWEAAYTADYSAPTQDESEDTQMYVAYEVENDNEAKILITKKDDVTGELLSGAEFKAFYPGTNTEYGTFTETTKGNYELAVNLGTNTSITLDVKETKNPPKCKVENWQQTGVVVNTSTRKHVVIDVTNTSIKMNIKGIKTAKNKANTNFVYDPKDLAGATYGLYIDNKCTVLKAVAEVKEDGTFAFDPVPVDTYYVQEITPPTSGKFKLSNEIKSVEPTNSEIQNAIEMDVPLECIVNFEEDSDDADIAIHKVGYANANDASKEVNEINLQGIGFTIYQASSTGIDLDAQDALIQIEKFDYSTISGVKPEVFTDVNGNAKITELPFGTYLLVETTYDAAKYDRAPVKIITVDTSSKYATVSYKIKNYPSSSPIKVIKVSEVDNSPIVDTEFNILRKTSEGNYVPLTESFEYEDEDGNIKTETSNIVLTTNDDGYVFSEPLEEGTYIIEEVKANGCYVLPENRRSAEIVIGGSNPSSYKLDEQNNKYYEVTFKDSPTETYISKKDITTKEEIPGATLELFDEDDVLIETWVSTSEAHKILGLKRGAKYRLVETLPPDTYTTAESVTFTVNENGTPTKVEMLDDYIKVDVSKLDITGLNEIPGAKLKVTDENGTVIDEWTSTDKPHRINYLSTKHTYTLTELTAPFGYIKSEDVEFEVCETGVVQQVTMYDDYTRYSFLKIDARTQEPLAGAELELRDSKGKLIDKWTSTTEAHMIYKLGVGETYTLTETKAPSEEYKIGEPIVFTVKEISETVSIIVENEPSETKIYKKDQNGNPVMEAKLQILDQDKNVVAEWTTGLPTEGGLSFYLPAGKYTLHEAEAPKGYLPSDDIEFEVNGTSATIEMTDIHIETRVLKLDADTHEMVPGATLQILDKDGNVVEEWVTDGTAHVCCDLVYGEKYVLHELIAPNTYRTAQDIEFTVDQDVISIELYENKTELRVKKTNVLGIPISDATMQILDENNNVIKEFVSGSEETVIKGLKKGKYTLHEAKAPGGYELAEDIEFTIGDDVVNITMTDQSTLFPPLTGGTGRAIGYILTALLFMLLSILFAKRTKKIRA